MAHIFVISGPSASGKTTIADALLSDESLGLHTVKSYTTRASRGSSYDDDTYEFVTKDVFLDMMMKNELIEHSNVYGEFYGCDAESFRRLVDDGKDIIKVLDHKGAYALKRRFGDEMTTLILLVPQDEGVLLERMRKRGTSEDSDVSARLDGYEDDIVEDGYDYVLASDDFDETLAKARDIIVRHMSR